MIWNKITQFVRKWWKVIVTCVICTMLAFLIPKMKINWRVLILHDSERVTIKVK